MWLWWGRTNTKDQAPSCLRTLAQAVPSAFGAHPLASLPQELFFTCWISVDVSIHWVTLPDPQLTQQGGLHLLHALLVPLPVPQTYNLCKSPFLVEALCGPRLCMPYSTLYQQALGLVHGTKELLNKSLCGCKHETEDEKPRQSLLLIWIVSPFAEPPKGPLRMASNKSQWWW